MIVHPAFKLGDKELTGIWVAKFEASGVNDLSKTDTTVVENWTNYVGNRSATSSTPVAVTDNTVLTIKPSVPSWRDITIGDAQTQSMKLTNSTNYGWTTNTVDGHLIKNTEWGAVAYLCYSKYGNIPMINGCGLEHKNDSNVVDYKYDIITGAGPKTSTDEGVYEYNKETFLLEHSYSTKNGQLASTTGNVYGIYDMSGGSFEIVAAYFDNGNYNLKIYGQEYFNGTGGATVDSSIKAEYVKYWDIYEVGEEEKNNAIKISDGEVLTQIGLYTNTINKLTLPYNEAKKRIVVEKVNNMATHKGDAMYERITEGEISFYSMYNAGTAENPSLILAWFKEAYNEPNASNSEKAISWNGDAVFIAEPTRPFIVRSSLYTGTSYAGVSYSTGTNGFAVDTNAFRPVLAF